MLVQTIIKYHPPHETAAKPKFRAGSDEHLSHIFLNHLNAALNNSELQLGKSVNIKGRKRSQSRAVIIHIEENIELVEWTGFKCRFIEVWFPHTEETMLYHPSELETM